jgi:hypothetical protein
MMGAITIVIITTMMLPSLFGFQDVRQWAGMYTNTLCQIKLPSGTWYSVGREGETTQVWTAPSLNPALCVRWVQDQFCTRNNLAIDRNAIEVYFANQKIVTDQPVCRTLNSFPYFW